MRRKWELSCKIDRLGCDSCGQTQTCSFYIPGPELVSWAKISWYLWDSTYLILRNRSDGSPCKNVNISPLAMQGSVTEQVSLRCPYCTTLEWGKLNPTQSSHYFHVNVMKPLLTSQCKQIFMGTHPEGYWPRWFLRRIFVKPVSQRCQNTLPVANQANF